ncbi:MAG TPA: HD family hydrolase [Thermodesulfobacteriota bacterium]|nr:HD family hydrolase [Thermodesulfobacteriota bacterium]
MVLDKVYSKFGPNVIQTFTGEFIDVFDPDPNKINIEDIAHALSNVCRYGGHCPEFYSVAQHSVLCSEHIDRENPLELLLHDSSEAYMMDIPSPIKKRFPEYKKVENKLLEIIFKKYGLDFPLSKNVKKIDGELLKYEYKSFFDLKNGGYLKVLTPKEAKLQFIERFNELTK